MKRNQPKGQHQVPQVLLRRFADKNEKVWVFDREKKEFRKNQNIKDVCKQMHVYTGAKRDGSKDYVLEDEFAALETTIKPILDKLDTEYIPNLPVESYIHPDDAPLFLSFVGYQHTRVTAWMEMYNDHLRKTWNVDRTYHPFWTRPAEKNLPVPVNIYPWSLTRIGYSFALGLGQKNLKFFYAPQRKEFLVSDNPVVGIRKWDHFEGHRVGLFTKNGITLMPVSRKVCFVSDGRALVKKDGDTVNYFEFGTASEEFVDAVNRAVALYSDRFVLTDNETLLRSVVQDTGLLERPRNKWIWREVRGDISQQFETFYAGAPFSPNHFPYAFLFSNPFLIRDLWAVFEHQMSILKMRAKLQKYQLQRVSTSYYTK